MNCPQCGYEIQDEKTVRCPRCFKSLLHAGSCLNCGKCGKTKLIKEVINKKST